MWWRETLPEETRFVVDDFVRRMTSQNWRERRDMIEAVVVGEDAFEDAATRSFITGAVVAAILEQLDETRVADADQALIYAMSANLEHQAAACDWFLSQGDMLLSEDCLAEGPPTIH